MEWGAERCLCSGIIVATRHILKTDSPKHAQGVDDFTMPWLRRPGPSPKIYDCIDARHRSGMDGEGGHVGTPYGPHAHRVS